MHERLEEIAKKCGFTKPPNKNVWICDKPTAALETYTNLVITEMINILEGVQNLPNIRTTYDQETLEYVKKNMVAMLKENML
jgi:ABC-type lipoprotein export system ATPase subunit